MPRYPRLTAALGVMAVALSGAISVISAPVVHAAVGPTYPTYQSSWLPYYNFWRASAGLNTVTEDPALSSGDQAHVNWEICAQVQSHVETNSVACPATQAGQTAASKSDLTALHGATSTPEEALRNLMTAPFHALQLLTVGRRAESGSAAA